MSWQLRLFYWLMPGLTESVQLCVAVRALANAQEQLALVSRTNCGCITDLADKGIEDANEAFVQLHRVPGDRLDTLLEVFAVAIRR